MLVFKGAFSGRRHLKLAKSRPREDRIAWAFLCSKKSEQKGELADLPENFYCRCEFRIFH